jgi:hypothetical protein
MFDLKGLETYHMFPGLESNLLIQLEQIESVLRLACLYIDLFQKLSNHSDNLGQGGLIRVIIRSMSEHGLKK